MSKTPEKSVTVGSAGRCDLSRVPFTAPALCPASVSIALRPSGGGIGLPPGAATPSRFSRQIRAKTRISGRLTDVGGLTLDSDDILVKSLRFRMG